MTQYNLYYEVKTTGINDSDLMKLGEGSQSSVFDANNIVIKKMLKKEFPDISVIEKLKSIDPKDDDLMCLRPLRFIVDDDTIEVWFYKSTNEYRKPKSVWIAINKLHQHGLCYWDAHPDNFVNFRPVDFGLITIIDNKPWKIRSEVPVYALQNGILCDYYFLNKYFINFQEVADLEQTKDIRSPWLLSGLVVSEEFIDNRKFKIFISHKSELKNIFVIDLFQMLSKMGITSFLDIYSIPKKISQDKVDRSHKFSVENTINKAIQNAKAYILIRTNEDSVWVKREFQDCIRYLEDDVNKQAIVVDYDDFKDSKDYLIPEEISKQIRYINLPKRDRKAHKSEQLYLNDILEIIRKYDF